MRFTFTYPCEPPLDGSTIHTMDSDMLDDDDDDEEYIESDGESESDSMDCDEETFVDIYHRDTILALELGR